MPRTGVATNIPVDQSYQDFLQVVTDAIAASNKAKNLIQANANNKLIVSEFITAITHITKKFNVYAARLFRDKLFFPLLEEFFFSFIAENLYELKKVVGNDYAGLLGADSIRDEIRKIEIYLNEQIMQLQDYRHSLQLSDKASQLSIEWQKDPLKKLDWLGLRQYKEELTTIQEQFKTYKTQLDPTKWLKPIVEFSETLECTPLDISLLFSANPPAPVVQTANELELRKDVYALERVLNYFELATTVNLDKEPLGPTVIERALQVAGEYFKSTADSPHLSPAMEQKLKDLKVPTVLIESLRNSLSHSGSFLFTLREEIKNNPNKLKLFKRVQPDLSKINTVLTKIIYRIHLKGIKSSIAAISNSQLTPEIQRIFSEIDISEDLGEIEAHLQRIIEKIPLTTIGADEKLAISSKIDGIRINIKLKQTAEYIRKLEGLNLNQADLETLLADLDVRVKLERYNELIAYKRNHVIPSKSVITEAAGMPGLDKLPIDTHSIDFKVSTTELFDRLIKEIFKGYENFGRLSTDKSFFGKEGNLADTLLLNEINRFFRKNKLSFTPAEKDVLLEKIKLFHQLGSIKTSFLESLEEIKYTPITTSALNKLARQAGLNSEQKALLNSALFELHQELFFNRLFETYFDSLLTEIQGKISSQAFDELKAKLGEQKKAHRALKKISAFADKVLTLSEAEYHSLVTDLIISVNKKDKLQRNYLDNAEIKQTLGSLSATPYEDLLNGIKNQEPIYDVLKKFKKFSKELKLIHTPEALLDQVFKENEIGRFENLFLEKLHALNSLVNLKENSNPIVKTSYEMVLSDLANLWKNLLKVANPVIHDKLFLEHLLLDGSAIDNHFSLRNYLAHGDPLFDAINPNFIEQVIENIPQLVKEAKAWLALKKLVDDSAMRKYLEEDVIEKGHIDQLSAEILPPALSRRRGLKILLREFQQSPRWKAYLATISPNHRPASPTAPIDQGKTLVKGLFERELREAARVNDLAKLSYCVQQGINIEVSDTRKWSAIYYAVEGGGYATFEFLLDKLDKLDELDKKARLDRLDSAGVSALHYMANNLDPRFANALVTRGKWGAKINRGKWSLLQLAAIQNNPIVIDALVKNRISKINAANQLGFTALLAAVYFDHADLAEHLVTVHKADVLATTKKKFSVVHLTTINNNLALLQKLKQLDSNLALDEPLWAGWSAIHMAALKNLPEFLQYFIDNKVDANLSGKDGMTPLHVAAQEGHIASIEILMRTAGVIPRTINQHGSSVLLTAVSNKQLAAVEKILELDTTSNSVDDRAKLVNLADREGWSPLHVAVLQANLEMTQFLLRKRAAVDQKKLNGITASHIAAQHGYLEILQQLKSRRANFNELALRDWTVLHFASFYGHPEVITYLLNLHTPLTIINSLTEDGFTALHLAVIKGHTDVTEELLKSSAIKTEINKKTKRTVPDPDNPANTIKIEDATASHLAVKQGYLSILKKLAENGADLRLTGNEDWTHLHLAADAGHADIVDYFLKENSQVINLEAKTKRGETALHRAALQGYSNIVDDLLAHNANVRARTKQNATPLHLAASAGQLNVVTKLLQHGAQLEAKTKEWLTPLALAAQYGQLTVVTDLLKRGANPLSKNDRDTVLHRAAASANPEIIKSIIAKIKTRQPAERFKQALNERDTEGDTPLIWAVKTKNPTVLEVLLQEGADFQIANLERNTAFDIAVRTTYPSVDRSDKNAIKIWKAQIEHQQKIIELLYLKKHPASNSRAMKDRFITLINEEFRTHVSCLEFEPLKTLHNTLDETGNIAFWNSIAGKVRKRIKEEYPDIALNPTTQSETPALQDLMRTFAWASLDDLSLNELNSHKLILAYKKLQKKTIAPAAQSLGCKSETSRKRKRSAARACLDNEKEIEKFDPLIEFNETEKEASTLLMASAQTAEQRTKLSENIIHIHQIKAEGPLNQSQMELKKLDVFHENLEKTIEKKEQYLQKTNDIDQAKVIRLSDHNGKSVYLSIHTESLAGKRHLSIYCPQINGYGPLQLNPDLPISEALELYATLLFSNQATQSLSYEYYTILPSQLSTLSAPLEFLTTSDFRSDKTILESNHNLIEGIKTTEFRELFLVNGEVPEVEQLHSNIFNDPDATITFRSDKIVSKLWEMSPEQQTTLAAAINKYDILEEPPLVTEDTLDVERCLQKFNCGFIEKLKRVTPETPITHDELTARSKQYLREELLTEGFESHEIDKIINNVVDLHGDLHQGLSRAVGMTRQGIFLAPAIIQAMNGDTRGLNNLLMMMGGDMAIDHVYQALLNDAKFIERFPKTSGLLSKSVRYLASPIGKVLLLDSFIELGKQMQESEPGSPEYQLAESLLADNSLFFATMVAEVIGLELGPAGILLDIGVTIHQLMATAKYYRNTLPFKISFWESIEITLGFKKTWLEEKFAEHYIRDVQLRQINDLTHTLNKVFYAAFIREPLLEISMRQEVTLDKLPSEMQTAISNRPRDPQSSFEWSYKPPKNIYRKYISVDTLPVYQRIFYRLKTVSTTTALLEPIKAKQENSVFLRTHQVCHSRSKRETNMSKAMDVAEKIKIRKKRVLMRVVESPKPRCLTYTLYSQGYWRVAGSTLREDGEEFTSPIKITGGLAGLMLNNRHPDLSEQNLLINFNSCFGDTAIIGGPFLKDKLAYVLISNLMMENLLDPLLHMPVSKFSFNNTKEFTDNITYIVNQNYHPSEITDDAKEIHIVMLPINFKPELSGLQSHLDKATFSTAQRGSFNLGEIGPRFIGLDAKKRVIINFHKDYSVSGAIAIKTKDLQLAQVRGNITNPATFLLTKKQSFSISLLAGKTSYQLDGAKVLEVTFNDTLATQGPRITKSSKDAIFKLFMKEPLCDLVITKAASTTSLSLTNILTVQTFNSNATLSIHGNYFFKGNQTCQAELKLMDGTTSLTLIDIADHKQLLRDPGFFSTIKQQNLDSVNFYSSGTRSNISVALHSNGQQMTYQAITYRLDSEHGLVAIQGRTSHNSTQEDFSNVLTSLIDVQGNTTWPLRLNTSTVEVEGRQLLNLKPSSYLLTTKGKLPVGLLPVRLPTVQQGDSIQLDELSGLLRPDSEIGRVSIRPDVSGLHDNLILHYRPLLPRLKREISNIDENSIEIYFKKQDNIIPKMVVIHGKVFTIDFSELPLLDPQQALSISHAQFNQLSNNTALQVEEINGEILAEMQVVTNKLSDLRFYRISQNIHAATYRFIDVETQQEKQAKLNETALLAYTPAPTWHVETNFYAISFGVLKGATTAGWEKIINSLIKKGYFEQDGKIAWGCHYLLKPVFAAGLSAMYHSLYTALIEEDSSVFDREIVSSAFVYFTINYMSITLGQWGLNKLLGPGKAFTLFFIFSNLSLFVEGFTKGFSLSTVEIIVNILCDSLFSAAGYYGTKKVIDYFTSSSEKKNNVGRESRTMSIVNTHSYFKLPPSDESSRVDNDSDQSLSLLNSSVNKRS
jgi:ankyrin repeat protein